MTKKMTVSHYACYVDGAIIATFKNYAEAAQFMLDILGENWESHNVSVLRVYAR